MSSGLSGLSGLSGVFGGDVPPVTSGLVADWDPAALALNDGDLISSLTDTFGGWHATAAGANRPTFKANVRNGKPCARFDGSNNLSTASINLSGTQAVTVVLVATAASGSDQILMEFSSNFNSFTDGFSVFRAAANGVSGALKGNVGINDFTTARAVTTRPECIIATLDKANAQSPPNASAIAYRESLVSIDGLQGQGSNGWGTASNNTNTFGTYPIYLGARNASSVRLTGDLFRALLYNRALTSSEQGQIARWAVRTWALQHTSGTLAFVGDSMTAGTNATSPYPSQCAALLVADGYDFNWGNIGMSGWTLQNMIDSGILARATPAVGIDGGKSIAVLWGGTNDMASPGSNQSAATTYTRLQAAAATLRSAGYKVAVTTCLARNDVAAPVDFETKRQAYNTSIRAGWASFADALIDLSTDVRLDDGSGTLPAGVDSGDHVHLNNTGNGYVAALAKLAIEAL